MFKILDPTEATGKTITAILNGNVILLKMVFYKEHIGFSGDSGASI